MGHHVTGVFSDSQSAECAVRDLIESHFNPDEISIVVADREGIHEEEVEHDTGVAEGAAGGAALGGLLGALGATLVATGIVVAPQLGVFATGPLLRFSEVPSLEPPWASRLARSRGSASGRTRPTSMPRP